MSAHSLGCRRRAAAPIHIRCVGEVDGDLVSTLVLELACAVRDGLGDVVVDLRLARPGNAADVERLVETVAAAGARGVEAQLVGRPRTWFAPLAAAGYHDVLLVTVPLALHGVVLVGRNVA